VTLQPFVVARYGIWLALATATVSVWLGQRNGASLDFAVFRGAIIFTIVAVLAVAAEAVVSWQIPERPASPGDRDGETEGENE
jgi:hypothetical protein